MAPPCRRIGPRVRSISVPESWAISGRTCISTWPARAGGPGWSGRCARRCGPGGCAPAPGCRRPGRWPRDLRIARNTVAEPYGQLVAEGWLTARQGSGTGVAERVAPPADRAAPAPPGRGRAGTATTAPGSPDLSSFPRAGVAGGQPRGRWRRRPRTRYGYGDPRGRPELRRALADYLARARGVHADAERIVVCSGFTQALGLLCEVLRAGGARDAGDRGVGASRPPARSSPPAGCGCRRAGRRARRRAGPADADVRAADPGAPVPDRACALAARRRRTALRWASDRRRWSIEDDYDGEFRYDRHPVGALQALAPGPGRVRGDREQDARPGAAAGLAGAAGAPGRRRGRGQGAGRPADRRAGAAGDGGVHRPRAATTGTCAGAGWRTGGAGTGWWRR